MTGMLWPACSLVKQCGHMMVQAQAALYKLAAAWQGGDIKWGSIHQLQQKHCIDEYAIR